MMNLSFWKVDTMELAINTIYMYGIRIAILRLTILESVESTFYVDKFSKRIQEETKQICAGLEC